MNDDRILTVLNEMSEDEMIEKVILPLYEKKFREYFFDIEFSGKDKREDEGVDITYYEIAKDTKTKQYRGIQVKQGEINTGKSANGIVAIRIQAEQAFEKNISNVTDKKTYRIQKYVVLTTGKIQAKARAHIVEKLAHHAIEFVDGKMLCAWIRESFLPELVKICDVEEIEEDNEENDATPLEVITEHLKENCKSDINTILATYRVLDTNQQAILKALMELRVGKHIAIAAIINRKAQYVEEDLRTMCGEDLLEHTESGYSLNTLSDEWSRIYGEATEYTEMLGYQEDEVQIRDIIMILFP